MKIDTITVGPLQTNCYLISDPESNEALVIDPGSDAETIIDSIVKQKLNVKYIIATHCHIDHVAEAKTVQDHFDVPFLIHENEVTLLDTLESNNGLFGITVYGRPKTGDFLQHSQTITVGSNKGKILFTPGHSPGGVCISFPGYVFAGDSLFRNSIGRTDLPGGNYNQLIESIHNQLFTLADDTIVYPGHGPETSIKHEKQYNPFVKTDDYI